MPELTAIDDEAGVGLLKLYADEGEVAAIIRSDEDGHFRLIAHNSLALPVLLRAAADAMDAKHRQYNA